MALNLLGPPTVGSDPQQNFTNFAQWFQSVFNALIRLQASIDELAQFDSSFDPSSLPDPATATPGSAQQTANEAYALASSANAKADALIAINNLTGTFEVSGAETSKVFTFEEAQEDAEYELHFEVVSITGSPTANSLVRSGYTKTAANFEVTLAGAPGAGATVTFSWWLRRNVGSTTE